MPPRVWLITGASMGLGRDAAEEVLNNGEILVAAVRSPSSLDDLAAKYPASQLLVVKCDVVNRQDIINAFDRAIDKFGRVDVVFNNAGIGVFAEAESDEQDEAVRKVFEVNFWGAVNVIREAVKTFRDRNPGGAGGRLLNNSSVSGVASAAGAAFYGASKHALEGYTDSLAQELDPAWNIKITSVQPGIFKTGAHTARVPTFPPHPAYTNPNLPSNQFRKVFSKDDPIKIPFGDPKKAVRKVFEISQVESPPLHLPLGQDSLAGVLGHWAKVEKEVKEYQSWSADLLLDD